MWNTTTQEQKVCDVEIEIILFVKCSQILYVTERKLCIVIDSQVKFSFCMLSYKNCHITLVCLQQHVGNILTTLLSLY